MTDNAVDYNISVRRFPTHNTDFTNPNATLTPLTGGNFVLIWSEPALWIDASRSIYDIFGQELDSNLKPLGLSFKIDPQPTVDTTTLVYGVLTSTAALVGGGYVVTWANGNSSSSHDTVAVAQYNQYNELVKFQTITPPIAQDLNIIDTFDLIFSPQVEGTTDGGYDVQWRDEQGVQTTGSWPVDLRRELTHLAG